MHTQTHTEASVHFQENHLSMNSLCVVTVKSNYFLALYNGVTYAIF